MTATRLTIHRRTLSSKREILSVGPGRGIRNTPTAIAFWRESLAMSRPAHSRAKIQCQCKHATKF